MKKFAREQKQRIRTLSSDITRIANIRNTSIKRIKELDAEIRVLGEKSRKLLREGEDTNLVNTKLRLRWIERDNLKRELPKVVFIKQLKREREHAIDLHNELPNIKRKIPRITPKTPRLRR